MLKNYFVIAIRNFWRHKVFSLINVIGLAIGIAASLVIYLIIDYHLSFDTFHKDQNRIYRVVTNLRFSGTDAYFGGVAAPLYQSAKTELTGVQALTAFFFSYSGKVQITTNTTQPTAFKHENNIVYTDDNYFSLFPHQWLAGTPGQALRQPFETVITEAVAKKYFPHIAYPDILGRQIIYSDSIKTTVRGIVKDWKANSELAFQQFISLATMRATGLKTIYGLDDWGSTNSSSQLFFKLAPNTTPEQIHGQLKKLMRKYRPDDNKEANNTAAWRLQPLSELHFDSRYGNFGQPMGNISVLYSLGAAALFLLLLGCINFINLTTAQAAHRAKEIGVRKTMGGSKKQLVLQFLSETFFITLLATLLSVVLTPWLLKVFSDFIPDGIHFNLVQQPQILIFLLSLTLAVTLLSGFYPAYVLANYKPVLVLKNQAYAYTGRTRKVWLRKTLTVSQFVIAQVFVMGTLLVGKQIHYALTKDMGFKRASLLKPISLVSA